MPKEKKEKLWEAKDVLHDVNVNKLYWNSIEKLTLKEDQKALEIINDYISITPRIVENYIKNRELKPLLNISKATMCYYTLILYIKANCIECLKNLVRFLHGSVELSLGFERLLREEKNNEQVSNFIKKLIKEGQLEILMLLSNLSDELKMPFLEEIKNVAKNEIGEAQYIALNILSTFIEDKEVLSIYKQMANDWDIKVRRISLNVLAKLKDREDIKALAKKLLRDETDETNIQILKSIIGSS